jgi:hypothetical protein
MAEHEKPDTEIVEEGDIFFLYRPRVEEHDPQGLEDVQRFHMVMRPKSGGKLRLCVVGRKRLPEAGKHERVWGFVDAVTDSGKSLESRLQEDEYETKTRGERHMPSARPAGEGVYAVSREDSQLHLSYVLELPEKPGEVQQALKIAPEAAYVLSIKNPEAGQPRSAGLSEAQKADYPEKLEREFEGRRFEGEDLRLLDYEGAEFILVGARRDPEAAYDLDLESRSEPSDYAHADSIRRLRMVKSRHPVTPLFEGRWD